MSVQLPYGTPHFRAERRYRGIELFLWVETDREQRVYSVVENVVLTERREGEFYEGFLTLPQERLQELMDDLWHCGLRPSAGVASAGQLEAKEAHLQDMRAFAFHRMGVDKP